MIWMSSQYGRVGLRRQFQVLVRKGVGSNPTVDIFFLLFFGHSFVQKLRICLSSGRFGGSLWVSYCNDNISISNSSSLYFYTHF